MGTRLHDLATSPPSEALSSHGGGGGGPSRGGGRAQIRGGGRGKKGGALAAAPAPGAPPPPVVSLTSRDERSRHSLPGVTPQAFRSVLTLLSDAKKKPDALAADQKNTRRPKKTRRQTPQPKTKKQRAPPLAPSTTPRSRTWCSSRTCPCWSTSGRELLLPFALCASPSGSERRRQPPWCLRTPAARALTSPAPLPPSPTPALSPPPPRNKRAGRGAALAA